MDVLVTHDRSFLERTCGEVLELDSAAVHSYQTEGSYKTFVRRRAEREVSSLNSLAPLHSDGARCSAI